MASCCRGTGTGTGTVTAFGLLPPSLSLHHLLLLLLLLAAAVHASSDLSTDAQALLAFKLAVAPDPQQLLTTWTSQSASNPCSWQGVTCSTAAQQRVVGLNLTGAQLLAQLPPSALSSLDALQYLSLAANSFYGNLTALEDLAHTAPLEVLDLSSNTFDGPIPLAFFSSRLTLNLANNQLSGGIPALPSPMHLDLSNNSLSGPLPPELFPSVDGPSLITLNLALNGFSGPIPSQLLNNCTTLQVLDLSANGLMGSIPPAPGFGKCSQLRYLNLSGNHFSGLAPSDLLQPSGLEVVDVSNNNLTGSLAPIRCPQNLSVLNMAWNHLSDLAWLNFTACPSLEILDLSGNGLSGHFLVESGSGSLPLPPSAPNLRIFHMADNNLSGSLPPQFPALFPALQVLDLSFNLLVGSVPSFPPGSPLVSLNLANNNFSGDLPVDLIYSLCAGNLQYLVLAFNAFTGQLPDSFLSECPQLKVLDLSSNSINGTVPADLCPEDVIPALQVFSIPNNAIYGPIPAGLAKCRNLMTLDLSFNFMNGPIPPELGSLEYLEYLYLWSNQLNGSIPSSLGNCSRLKGLVLNYNLLTGAIPPELSKCSELLWLSLNTNFLSGEIPREIGVMQKLALLQLGNNSFTGSIPTELGNCTGLVWLDVNRNQLTGSIPSPIGRRKFKSEINPDLEKFRFAFVKNIGPNCQGIGGLMEFSGIRLEELLSPRLISCNFTLLFSGPNNFYNWRNDSSIEYLDMSFNNLQGPIPDDFGNMKDLHVLNLAHNMLNGTLPESLGNSSSLESLTLSYNQFTGGIPASFAMLSFLSSFDVSNNQLSGQIPQGGQLDTFPAWVYANNTGLCGLTVLGLPPCSGNANGSGSGYGGDSAGGRGRHKRREALAPWATSLLLAFLISSGLVVVILVWWVWTGRRLPWWKQLRHRGSLETGHDRIPSWNAADWKSGYGREPLSINVATFERPLRRLTFANLLEATNGFSEESIIGAGGFGEVYKAELPDGTVAVKKLIHSSFQGDREFTAEMETLGKIKHHNLVPLLGYCKVGEERLLVYEFMACGSLEHILHDREQPVEVDKLLHLQQMQQQLQAHQQMQQQQQQMQQHLPAPAPAAPAAKKVGNSGLLTPPLRIEFDWELRRQVAMGAARGLAFLHHNCIPHIIHRDMKSSNVLLDRHLVARVSDFGMARLISASDTHLSVSTLAGTPGYVPPEYYQSFRCTTKGDVYSFGVVLLELLTGKRPTNKEEFGDSNLVGWVKLLLAQKRSTEVLDPDLRGNGMEQDMLQHLRIACMCVEDVPSHRPTMLQVVAMFKELHLDNVS